MNTFFATFPAGCYEVIARQLKSFKIDELKITEHDDSSVSCTSSLSAKRLIELRFFTNIYVVIQDLANLPKSMLKGNYFRLMLLKDGKPQALGAKERVKLAANITKHCGLKPHTHLSRNDFYLIERTNGTKLLTLRLSRAKFKRDELQAGELRPELAHILCLTAGLKAKHTVLDMFAGYGAIPFEAVRGFGCRQVTATDVELLPKRRGHSAIKWRQSDARQLNFIANESIDRVIVDPPWGAFENITEQGLIQLYDEAAAEIERVLKPKGVAVVLTGLVKAEQCLTHHLTLLARWNVLVSGHKATIFKLQKS